MTGRCNAIVATVSTLALLGLPSVARAEQSPQPPVQLAASIAALASGSLQGVVKDEAGAAVVGAMVSAVGATPTVAVTDREGRFTFETLSPGPYFVRVHLSGYIAPRAQMVEVRSSTRTSSTISLRRADSNTVLEAGLVQSEPPAGAAFEPQAPAADTPSNRADDESEMSCGSDISAAAS